MSEFGARSRVILYHKQATSALVLFLRHPDQSVCAPGPLPKLSSVTEASPAGHTAVTPHPSAILRSVGEALKLPPAMLKVESEYHERVDTPAGPVSVYLARFDTLDPPHGLMAVQDRRFLSLTALRGGPPAEMELLRRAYVCLMEG